MDSPTVAAVVLAGGRSSRMGRDKASLTMGGRTLLDRAIEAVHRVPGLVQVIVVLAADQASPARTGITVVRDDTPYAGPLAAIATGLRATDAQVALVLGCDTPFVQPSLLALLVEETREHAIVVPVHDGRIQPMCSAIRRDAMPLIAALVADGVRAATAMADDPRTHLLQPSDWTHADADALSFVGVNTPEELRRAEAIAMRLDGAEPTARGEQL